MKLKDILLAAVALSLIGGLGLSWLAPERLTQAPDITLTTLQGKQLSLPNLQGGPVLVNFWATSCAACLEEAPHLIKLYQELAPSGLEVIGIAMAYDPPNRVIALSQARQIPYPVALDIHGNAARAFGDVRLTPSSFLIAPDGRVIQRKIGKLDINKLRALIRDMLAQPQASDRRFAIKQYP